MMDDVRMEVSEAFVARYIEEFGSGNLPDLIAAVLDWYVQNGSGNFARNHVLPEAFKLLDMLEIPVVVN